MTENKLIVTVAIINEYLKIFELESIDSLNKLPKIKKTLFDTHKDALDKIVTQYIEILKNLYGAKEIKYYNRLRTKSYAYNLFKILFELNKIELRTKRTMKSNGDNSYESINYCYL
jgi:hypothetical protein